MRELPTKTTGAVSVRSLDGRRPSTADARTTATAVASRPDTGVTRAAPKLLRFPAVRERTGLSRSTIWRLERRGEFPKHHRIAPNVVAWTEEEVSYWIQSRVGGVAI